MYSNLNVVLFWNADLFSKNEWVDHRKSTILFLALYRYSLIRK